MARVVSGLVEHMALSTMSLPLGSAIFKDDFHSFGRECLLVVGRGSWVPSRGSWVPSRGSQVVGRGFQVVGRGFQVVGRGSWVIDWKGSALARRRFFGIPSNSKQSLQQQIRHVF